MNVADKICEKAKNLPESLAKQVLDFIEQLGAREDFDIEAIKQVQEPVMNHIWENKEDDVWNEH